MSTRTSRVASATQSASRIARSEASRSRVMLPDELMMGGSTMLFTAMLDHHCARRGVGGESHAGVARRDQRVWVRRGRQ